MKKMQKERTRTNLESMKESGLRQRPEERYRQAPFGNAMSKMSYPVRQINQRLSPTTSLAPSTIKGVSKP